MHISSSVTTTVSAYPNKRPLDVSRTSHNTRITITARKLRKLQADKAAQSAEAARRKAPVARKLQQTARLKGQHGVATGGWQETASDMANNDNGAARGRRGWQDIRAMHDLGASDENNAPWRQDFRSMYSLTAFCTAKRIHGDQFLP